VTICWTLPGLPRTESQISQGPRHCGQTRQLSPAAQPGAWGSKQPGALPPGLFPAYLVCWPTLPSPGRRHQWEEGKQQLRQPDVPPARTTFCSHGDSKTKRAEQAQAQEWPPPAVWGPRWRCQSYSLLLSPEALCLGVSPGLGQQSTEWENNSHQHGCRLPRARRCAMGCANLLEYSEPLGGRTVTGWPSLQIPGRLRQLPWVTQLQLQSKN
jgi:hypothetical protein